jgi:hypothetical protein
MPRKPVPIILPQICPEHPAPIILPENCPDYLKDLKEKLAHLKDLIGKVEERIESKQRPA